MFLPEHDQYLTKMHIYEDFVSLHVYGWHILHELPCVTVDANLEMKMRAKISIINIDQSWK